MPYVPPINNRDTQHEGTDDLAVNNIFLRRFITLVALKTTAKFFRYNGPCIPISKHLIVKSSPFVHLTEAAAMKFVAAKTSVPRVHCSFVHGNRAYIVMERIQGESLPKALKKISDADHAGVGSCAGGSLCDSRIPHARPRFGPFKTIQDFHLWLRDGLQPEGHPNHVNDEDWNDIKEMATKQDGSWPAPVFTHGDLNPSNILVRGTQVIGIIDWEFSGWYPFYWEYTSAWYGGRLGREWQDMIAKFLDPCPDELRMEIIRQKWWGDF